MKEDYKKKIGVFRSLLPEWRNLFMLSFMFHCLNILNIHDVGDQSIFRKGWNMNGTLNFVIYHQRHTVSGARLIYSISERN